MKFYGVEMMGKFINHKLSTVPAFDPTTDVGRLIYTEDDGLLWWGDGDDGVWKSIGETLSGIGITNATLDVHEEVIVAATDTVTVSYTVGEIVVSLNGQMLALSDYTATNGTSIVFDAPDLQIDDVVHVYSVTTTS